MDRTMKLKELRARLQEMTATENDEDMTVRELNDIIISAAAETVDHMITSGLSEQTVKTATFSTTSGTLEYDLSSASIVPDQDFYKVSKVFVDEGGGQYRPIERINVGDRQAYRPPQSTVSIILHYIPLATNFKDSNGEYNDEATFDGINGWEEHTLCTAAMQVKAKKEEDFSYYARRKAELEERMAFLGNTDFSGPATVVRRRGRQARNSFFPYQNQVSAWSIRNKQIALYYAYPWVP